MWTVFCDTQMLQKDFAMLDPSLSCSVDKVIEIDEDKNEKNSTLLLWNSIVVVIVIDGFIVVADPTDINICFGYKINVLLYSYFFLQLWMLPLLFLCYQKI